MISPFAAGSFATQVNADRLVAMKNQFTDLNRQLTTGKVAQTYGGLGLGRRTDLSAHAQIAALDGYDSAISAAQLRLKLQNQGVETISSSVTTAKNSLLTQYRTAGAVGRTDTQTTMAGAFDAALDALNQNVAGRYLFGGTTTDVAPVAPSATILDGDAATGAAGLKAVIAERKAADRGAAPEIGRLALGGTGSTVSLGESADPGVRDNFGFTILGATPKTGAITATPSIAVPGDATPVFARQPRDGDVVRLSVVQADGSQTLVDLTARAPGSGAPGPGEFAIGADAAASAANLKAVAGGRIASAQSASPPGVRLTYAASGTPGAVGFTVAAQPADGAAVTVTLGLRDGTSTTLTLTARAGGGAKALDPAREFAIGATTDETAANLKAALGTALNGSADTDLAAASAVIASNDFFAGSRNPAFAPRRVAGPTSDPATATGFASAPDPAKTVIWYRGDDTPGADPRASAPVQVDRSLIVGTGTQANEPAFRAALASFGVLAADAGESAATDDARYGALTSRVATALTAQPRGGSVDEVGTQLAQATVSLSDAQSRHKATRSVLQDTVSGIEDASTDAVAAQLLAVQTALQASYQTTSMLSKLSLTSYL